MRLTFIKSIFILGVILLLNACSGTKKIVYEGPMPERSHEELLNALDNHNYQFDWVTSKADLNVESPDESFKGTLYFRLKRDSIIWVVMKKFSAEAIRALATHDSIYAIDRINAKYTIKSFDEFSSLANVKMEFVELQDFLFGNVDLTKATFRSIDIINDDYVMNYDYEKLKFSYLINAYNLNLSEIRILNDDGKWVSSTFDDYKMVSDKAMLAHERMVQTFDPTIGLTTMRLAFKELEVDQAKTTKFSIPEHYERVD
jgi:hypothetical protein